MLRGNLAPSPPRAIEGEDEERSARGVARLVAPFFVRLLGLRVHSRHATPSTPRTNRYTSMMNLLTRWQLICHLPWNSFRTTPSIRMPRARAPPHLQNALRRVPEQNSSLKHSAPRHVLITSSQPQPLTTRRASRARSLANPCANAMQPCAQTARQSKRSSIRCFKLVRPLGPRCRHETSVDQGPFQTGCKSSRHPMYRFSVAA